MSYKDITRGDHVYREGVTIAETRYGGGSGKGPYTRAEIRIRQNVIQRLAWSGETFLKVHLGQGPDQGYILLEPSEQGHQIRRDRGSIAVTVNQLRTADIHRAERVSYEVLEHGRVLKIRLPGWAFGAAMKYAGTV